jgi:TATA-box binding protein (TBP) (component of TFIID and TFIIIB)
MSELGELGELEELEDIDLDDYDSKISNILNATVNSESETRQPVCSNIYISTKTKISYLNEPIDIKKVFWNIPISEYSTPDECIIKKQIKVSTTDPKELEEIRELLKHEKYYQEQEIEHIDNPEGRIKFKVQLKINIGLCKKDILNYRCKLKRAFFNCFVLIMRIRDHSGDGFKEMHIKVFNTGKLEIPGIQTDESLTQVLKLLITILKPIVGPHIDFIPDKCETVLINSNFNCGYFINRDRLYNILKYKYRINSNYDACSYPGIQSKFYYIPGLENQTGQHPPANEIDKAYEISFMIFRTGSVLIVGRCDENVLHCIYGFLKKLLEVEYPEIGNQLNIIQPKKQNVKLRRKVINVVEDI